MKLFGNRRRAAHTKKSALSRGTRTALIAAVIVLAVAGSAFAAWKLLVKPVERPALSEPEPEPPAEEEAVPLRQRHSHMGHGYINATGVFPQAEDVIDETGKFIYDIFKNTPARRCGSEA